MATYVPVGKLEHHRITHNMFVAKRLIDVDAQQGRGLGTAGQIDANSVLQAIPVRAGDTVLEAWVEVYTACTGGASVDVGVGENVDAWVNGAPLDAQAVDTAITAPESGPHYFHAADTIDAKVLEAAVTAGKFAVCALIIRL
jgi:hypothetical protein